MNRIAYLVSDYSAPSHTFVRREIAALRKIGLEILPFSVQPAEGVPSLLGRSLFIYPFALLWAFLSHPIRVISSWMLALRHRPPGLHGLLWSQFHFVEAMVLARLLANSEISRLHNHFANSGATVGMIAAHFLRLPWSMTLHGISETDYPAGLLLGEKLERAEFVACASYFMRAQAMRKVAAVHWPKLHIVRCGIDFGTVSETRIQSEIALQSAPLHLVCVGRLSPEKGYFGLLGALANLADDGLDFSLTIVGDGPSANDIQEQIVASALTDRVQFTGALAEMETLEAIGQCDIFVLPSLMEGLPVVLIEALALGKATIASRVAGIPELIEDGHSGLLFAPSDWQELESQLRRLFSDQELRDSLGKQGRVIAESQFDIALPARRLAQLFGSG